MVGEIYRNPEECKKNSFPRVKLEGNYLFAFPRDFNRFHSSRIIVLLLLHDLCNFCDIYIHSKNPNSGLSFRVGFGDSFLCVVIEQIYTGSLSASKCPYLSIIATKLVNYHVDMKLPILFHVFSIHIMCAVS